MMFWHPDKSKRNDIVLEHNESAAVAAALFDRYKSNFPLFWDVIDFDCENLKKIFLFFSDAQKLMLDVPVELIRLLLSRLSARSSGGPPPLPFGFESAIEDFSNKQIHLFEKLGPLVGPAFELFVTNALTDSPQYRQKERIGKIDETQEGPGFPRDRNPFGPDGPGFFFWAEFAFIAAYAGHHPNEWRAILRVLLRAERLFALTFGKPMLGSIPYDTKFSSYSIRDFSRIRPEDARRFPYPAGRRFDDLENEATACTHFAFPAGVD
jgi:hypothetical protein